MNTRQRNTANLFKSGTVVVTRCKQKIYFIHQLLLLLHQVERSNRIPHHIDDEMIQQRTGTTTPTRREEDVDDNVRVSASSSK
jgi:hypothetical protein